MPQVLKDGTRKARKQHRCGLCHAVICPGDTYSFQTCLYDGRVYDFRDCPACGRDGVLGLVYKWAGEPDEGVTGEDASDPSNTCTARSDTCGPNANDLRHN